MNRRGFLQAAVAAFALSTALARTALEVIHEAKRYVLMGDGVTDDTEAIQAALEGAPVFHADGSPAVFGSTVRLQAGRTYRISATINLPDHGLLDGQGCTIDGRDIPTGPALHYSGLGGISLSDMRVDRQSCDLFSYQFPDYGRDLCA